MPDSPITAKFLNEEDKIIAIERYITLDLHGHSTDSSNRLRMNQQGIENHEWKWEHVKEACQDLKSWLWFALMVSIS